jgi:hypothetical protein
LVQRRYVTAVYGLLGNRWSRANPSWKTGTEDIREAMLGLLGDAAPKQFANVTRRIRYANDIQGLWYLRGDLMAALAATHGRSGGTRAGAAHHPDVPRHAARAA